MLLINKIYQKLLQKPLQLIYLPYFRTSCFLINFICYFKYFTAYQILLQCSMQDKNRRKGEVFQTVFAQGAFHYELVQIPPLFFLIGHVLRKLSHLWFSQEPVHWLSQCEHSYLRLNAQSYISIFSFLYIYKPVHAQVYIVFQQTQNFENMLNYCYFNI